MFSNYNTSLTKLHQFKRTFQELVKETKAVLLDNNLTVAEDFERNAISFLRIIEATEGFNQLNSNKYAKSPNSLNQKLEDADDSI